MTLYRENESTKFLKFLPVHNGNVGQRKSFLTAPPIFFHLSISPLPKTSCIRIPAKDIIISYGVRNIHLFFPELETEATAAAGDVMQKSIMEEETDFCLHLESSQN